MESQTTTAQIGFYCQLTNSFYAFPDVETYSQFMEWAEN
jgi:hypothetical protein